MLKDGEDDEEFRLRLSTLTEPSRSLGFRMRITSSKKSTVVTVCDMTPATMNAKHLMFLFRRASWLPPLVILGISLYMVCLGWIKDGKES
jgi:hypothetical protein